MFEKQLNELLITPIKIIFKLHSCTIIDVSTYNVLIQMVKGRITLMVWEESAYVCRMA